MALFIQKPIFWNTNHYRAPSGVKATSGYPQKYGYGHEEWNNSPRLLLTRNQRRFRVFHTERLRADLLAENAGQTFVFMTASHDRIQQLVGIAGNAIGMSGDEYKMQRYEIAKELSLGDLWKEAWAVPNVRQRWQADQPEFRKLWRQNLHWIPNWICPDEFFWWLDEPVTLDAKVITGKSKLLQMFGRHTPWDLPTVARVLNAIPRSQRKEKWLLLSDALQCAPDEPLPVDEQPNERDPVTGALTLINARRGQGLFREDLMQIWDGACAVTNLDCPELLIASHIRPWRASNVKQKLNGYNGLMLCANLDRLFDIGLISFADNGAMLLSPWLSDKHRAELGLPRPLRKAPKQLAPFLKYHRDNVFQRRRRAGVSRKPR
jgi:HNH endonuclease